MSRADTAFAVVTSFWGVIGILCPILVQFLMFRSPNKGGDFGDSGDFSKSSDPQKGEYLIVQIMLMMTAACCYLFWLCAFLFQLNPLLGPQLESNMIRVMQAEWDGIDPEHIPTNPEHA